MLTIVMYGAATRVDLRNRSALAVICSVIIHCLEVSCKEDQITGGGGGGGGGGGTARVIYLCTTNDKQ